MLPSVLCSEDVCESVCLAVACRFMKIAYTCMSASLCVHTRAPAVLVCMLVSVCVCVRARAMCSVCMCTCKCCVHVCFSNIVTDSWNRADFNFSSLTIQFLCKCIF